MTFGFSEMYARLLGDFRQGLVTRYEAIVILDKFGMPNSVRVVDEWVKAMEWEDVCYEHRREASR